MARPTQRPFRRLRRLVLRRDQEGELPVEPRRLAHRHGRGRPKPASLTLELGFLDSRVSKVSRFQTRSMWERWRRVLKRAAVIRHCSLHALGRRQNSPQNNAWNRFTVRCHAGLQPGHARGSSGPRFSAARAGHALRRSRTFSLKLSVFPLHHTRERERERGFDALRRFCALFRTLMYPLGRDKIIICGKGGSTGIMMTEALKRLKAQGRGRRRISVRLPLSFDH